MYTDTPYLPTVIIVNKKYTTIYVIGKFHLIDVHFAPHKQVAYSNNICRVTPALTQLFKESFKQKDLHAIYLYNWTDNSHSLKGVYIVVMFLVPSDFTFLSVRLTVRMCFCPSVYLCLCVCMSGYLSIHTLYARVGVKLINT